MFHYAPFMEPNRPRVRVTASGGGGGSRFTSLQRRGFLSTINTLFAWYLRAKIKFRLVLPSYTAAHVLTIHFYIILAVKKLCSFALEFFNASLTVKHSWKWGDGLGEGVLECHKLWIVRTFQVKLLIWILDMACMCLAFTVSELESILWITITLWTRERLHVLIWLLNPCFHLSSLSFLIHNLNSRYKYVPFQTF